MDGTSEWVGRRVEESVEGSDSGGGEFVTTMTPSELL